LSFGLRRKDTLRDVDKSAEDSILAISMPTERLFNHTKKRSERCKNPKYIITGHND
jgi:hypothetical protein